MRAPITLLFMLCMLNFVVSLPGQKFIDAKTFPNPQKFKKAAFSENLNILNLYGPNSKKVLVYDTLTWKQITTKFDTLFSEAPSYMEFYAIKGFPYNIRYLAENGEVKIKNAIETNEQLIHEIKCQNPDSKKIIVGQEILSYAFCQGEHRASKLVYDYQVGLYMNHPIRQIIWKGSQYDTFFFCGSDQNGQNSYLIEFPWRLDRIDWTSKINGTVSAMAYSDQNNESLLYFTEDKTGKEQIIWKLNLETKQKSEFARLVNQTEITSLAVRKDYFSAKTEGLEYIWRRSDAFSLGKYESILEGSGLSPAGDYLVTVLASNPSKFQLRRRDSLMEEENKGQEQEFINGEGKKLKFLSKEETNVEKEEHIVALK